MSIKPVSEFTLRRWVMSGTEPASYLRRAVLPDLASPGAELPAGDSLEPLRWFLQRAAETIPLTQLHNLGRAFVLEADDRYHWYPANDFGWKPRLEADLPQLVFIHQFAKRQRAVRREGRRLKLTNRGSALVADPAALWEQAVITLASDAGFEGDLTETLFAVLLAAGPSEMTDRDLGFVAGDVMRASWWIETDEDSPQLTGRHPMFWRDVVDLCSCLAALDLVAVRDFREQEFYWSYRLTSAGRDTAVAVLRERARIR